MRKPLALPSSEVASPRKGTRLFFYDMPVAVRVLRWMSTSSFGLQSAGSLWCDRVAGVRAQWRAGIEVFYGERNEPRLSKVRCNCCASIQVAERCWWQVWFGMRDARQQVTHGSFQVWTKCMSQSTCFSGFTLALSWTSSVSVLRALECEASSVTGDLSSIACAETSGVV